jgi:HNH endonuclease
MKLFYAHAGKVGAAKHFPLTVFKKVPISVVEQNISPQNPSREAISNSLKAKFPSGYVNCWGVPTGGGDIYKYLDRGDVVLLVGKAASDGLVPALCEVKELLSEQEPYLSTALWNDDKYRYIFLFDTEGLDLTWWQLRSELGFSPNYNPGGMFMPVTSERLTPLGGAEHYVQTLRYRYGISHSPLDESPDTALTETVGASSTERVDQISRQLKRIRDASTSSEPVLTEGRSPVEYTRSTIPRDDAFRVGVAELYDYRCAICSLALRGPGGSREVQSAHIYPKAVDGKDDLRNGICLCRMHHWAFDAGWFWLTDDCTIIVRDDLPQTDDYAFIRTFENAQTTIPKQQEMRPHPTFLRARRRLDGVE